MLSSFWTTQFPVAFIAYVPLLRTRAAHLSHLLIHFVVKPTATTKQQHQESKWRATLIHFTWVPSLEYNRNFFHNLRFLHLVQEWYVCVCVCAYIYVCICMYLWIFLMPLWILAFFLLIQGWLFVNSAVYPAHRWLGAQTSLTTVWKWPLMHWPKWRAAAASRSVAVCLWIIRVKLAVPFESLFFFVNVINAFSKFLLLYLFIASCCEVPVMSPCFPSLICMVDEGRSFVRWFFGSLRDWIGVFSWKWSLKYRKKTLVTTCLHLWAQIQGGIDWYACTHIHTYNYKQTNTSK